jgi:hypothetical protein
MGNGTASAQVTQAEGVMAVNQYPGITHAG